MRQQNRKKGSQPYTPTIGETPRRISQKILHGINIHPGHSKFRLFLFANVFTLKYLQRNN